MGANNRPAVTWRRLATRGSIALSALMTTAAFAEENINKTVIDSTITTETTEKTTLTTAHFEERWSGLQTEFAVESGGIVRAITQAKQAIVDRENLNNESNNIGAYSHDTRFLTGNPPAAEKKSNMDHLQDIKPVIATFRIVALPRSQRRRSRRSSCLRPNGTMSMKTSRPLSLGQRAPLTATAIPGKEPAGPCN